MNIPLYLHVKSAMYSLLYLKYKTGAQTATMGHLATAHRRVQESGLVAIMHDVITMAIRVLYCNHQGLSLFLGPNHAPSIVKLTY